MRLLAACSLGGAGHLQPLLPWLSAARGRGDQVLVVGAPGIAEMVGQAGFDFRAGGQPADAVIAPIRERLATVPADEAAVLGNRELFGRLATAAMLEEMDRTCADWRPDLVLREPCEFASAVVAGGRGIALAQVAISLAEVESASIAVAAPALEAHRPGLPDELRASPYLSAFPASLDHSTFPRTVRYRSAPARAQRPLPDWWGGARGPLVYVTLGTVLGYLSSAPSAFAILLSALEGLEARLLLTVGPAVDPAGLGPVPANVHVEPWIDQVRVLGEASLVVCHGGSGTVLGALAAGVPLVVVPFFADQFANARRLAGSGAARVVARRHEVARDERQLLVEEDGAHIRREVEAALAAGPARQVARRLADEMAGYPEVDDLWAGISRQQARGHSSGTPGEPGGAG